ncbi:hypothetical protein QK289_14330 [Exiguobacterium antarcticum]|uniref:Uncharacterized protein n=1 Tax=Exiguobacterium antarcticum TaxID=132920 RepID=A0ABT6R5T2_9BACL|nr:hypothetical protein [Exiguobacterium antarcticum]MDI3236188.1 hypothetical protein [Exiguobacterium antarcticum]
MSQFTYTLNKYFNVEISGQEAIILVPTDRLRSENVIDISRGIKRVAYEHPLENNLLIPSDIEIKGSYARFSYDVSHYFAMDRLREYSDFKDKIDFYYSILNLALQQQEGNIDIIWERINFLVDEVEQNVKVMMYGTNHINNYVKDQMDLVHTVKSLIISTLTDLSEVERLPQRKNFIFSNDEVSIDFVEQLYPLTDLSEIKMLIDSFSLDFENENDNELVNESNPTTKKKTMFSLKEKQTKKDVPEKKSNTKRTKQINKIDRNATKTNKKKMKKADRNLMIAGIVMVICVLISLLTPDSSTSTNAKKSTPDKQYEVVETSSYFKASNSKAVQNAIVRAYRLAYNQNYQDAYKTIQPIDKRDLSSADLQLVIDVYFTQKKISILLDEAPVKEVANEIILFLIKKDKIEALPELTRNMKTENVYIDFEKAYVEGNYEKVISLMDKVEINGRKENQIVESYLELNRVDEANKFAQKVGNPDLFQKIEGYQ